MIGITPQCSTSFGLADSFERKHTIVNVPNDSVNLSDLSNHLSRIYSIEVEISQDSRVVKIIGTQEELCNAQNFALRFIGPESQNSLVLPREILELCQINTMKRYFSLRCRVIAAVRGNGTLILLGPRGATQRLSAGLSKLHKGYKSSIVNLLNPKKKLLKNLCIQFNIDYDQLRLLPSAMQSGLYELLLFMESDQSVVSLQAAGKSFLNNYSIVEPPYVEAFRLIRTKRLRPVIIDGANVAHTNVNKSAFNPKNLRYALEYFLNRGHDDIMFVMHGIRQATCSCEFSSKEIAQYFTFTSCRRLNNSNPMIADDDSVILEFALKKKAVVISNDQYRDWLDVRPEFREVIEDRVLPFSINAGIFVISHLPMGKAKPPLDEILCFQD